MQEWYTIRDLFIGDNYRDHDVREAIALARQSSHPLAKWLVSVIDTIDLSHWDEDDVLINALAADTTNVAEAKFLAGNIALYVDSLGWELIDEAARLGHPDAIAQMWNQANTKLERLQYDILAAARTYTSRDAMSIAAGSDHFPEEESNRMQVAAAHLGCVQSQIACAAKSHSLVWEMYWLCKAVPYTAHAFLKALPNKAYVGDDEKSAALYMAGSTIKDHLVWCSVRCHWRLYKVELSETQYQKTQHAIHFYKDSYGYTKKKCIIWLLCAKRMASSAGHPLCRDVRTKIAMLIWAGRGHGGAAAMASTPTN